MRVAHFVQRYPPALGGSEAYFARLSRHLAAVGDTVTVFTTTALDLEAFWSLRARCLASGIEIDQGVEVRRYRMLRWPGRRYLLKPLSLIPFRTWQCLTLPCNPIAPGMWRDAGRGEPMFDLVHATAFPYAWPIVCAARMARRRRIPLLVTPFLHLGDPENPRDPSRRAYLSRPLLHLLRQANRVFVQTPSERNALLQKGFPADRLVLLGMGVDPVECTGGSRDKVRHAWGVQADEVVIGHLANNSEEKGTVDLLRAAEKCWEAGKRFHVILAGPEMPNFRSFWINYGQNVPVQRLGVLDESQKKDFFAGIDIFALPSRSDSFGIVLLEAWANGKPNLAYRAGGIADVIRHESDGLLVRCGDVASLAESLGRLVADEPLCRRLGEAGLGRLRTEFR